MRKEAPIESDSLCEGLESRTLLTATGPHIINATLDDRGQAIIVFDQSVQSVTIGKSTAQIFTAGTDGVLGTSDDASQKVRFTLRKGTLTMTAALPVGTEYRVHLSAAIGGVNHLFLQGHYAGAYPTTGGRHGRGADFDVKTTGKSDIVVMNTTEGQMLVQLNSSTPQTTANFINYADTVDASNVGKYDNIFMQRNGKSDAAPLGPIAILQAGGFVINSAGTLDRVTTLGTTVTHERNGGSNLRGTIALARSSSADSGSAEWFFNETNNTFLDPVANDPNAGTPDNDPGAGYTVFGHVLNKASLRVMDAIYALKTANLNPTSGGTESDVGLHSVPIIGNPTAKSFNPSTNLVVFSRTAVLMNYSALT